MKKLLIPAAAVMACTFAQAGAGAMIGISYNFGGTVGITFKVLSTDKVDRAAAVVGVTYFPTQSNSPWGLDAGLGYNFSKATPTVTYDFLNKAPQLSLGFNNAKANQPTPQTIAQPPVVTPPPPPPPPPAPPVVIPPPPPPPPPTPTGGSALRSQGSGFGVEI